AGWLVAFVLVCAGPAMLGTQFAFGVHGGTVVHVCLLDAFLVWTLTKTASRNAYLLAATAVTVVTATGLASDDLLYPAGLIPFVLGALASRNRRVTSSAVAVSALAVAGSRIVI